MGFVEKIQRAHWMYREGKHSEALAFFTEALAMAKTKGQRITLHSNRAACYLRLHDFKNAMKECSSVLELDRKHEGALMIRVQTFVAMEEYLSAKFDIHRLIEVHPSYAYRDFEAILRSQSIRVGTPVSMECLSPIPECEEDACLAQCEEEEQSSITMPREKAPKESKPQKKFQGWETIPKPKRHSGLDYSRWDCAQDDFSSIDGGSENNQMMGGNYA